MSTCQAPHRLPDGYYDRLESMTPEAGAATFIGEVLADDYACGDPTVGTIQYLGHPVLVCQYHHDYFHKYIAPIEIETNRGRIAAYRSIMSSRSESNNPYTALICPRILSRLGN